MTKIKQQLLFGSFILGLVPLLMLFFGISYMSYGNWPWIFLVGAVLIMALTSLVIVNLVLFPLERFFGEAERMLNHEEVELSSNRYFPELRRIGKAFRLLLKNQRLAETRLQGLVDQRTRSLEESQKQLRKISSSLQATLDSSPHGLVVVDNEGVIVASNRSLARYFGLPSEIVGSGVRTLLEVVEDFFEGDEFGTFWESDQDCEEMELETNETEARYFSLVKRPVSGDEDVPFARLFLFADMTAQRDLEEGLRNSQKMEAVGRLAGGIAHDFNNLLLGISGSLELIQLETNQKDYKHISHSLENALKASKRASHLVRQLLGFSRKTHLTLEANCLNDAVLEVVDLIKDSLNEQIELVFEEEKALWKTRSDPTQFHQVLMNLCVNAIHAVEDSGRIVVKTSNHKVTDGERRGDYVVVSVKDDGMGIREEHLDKLFEPFFTTKEQGKGTGLGLAMASGIAEQHEGWMTCESEFGEGACFSIYFPRFNSDNLEDEGDLKLPEEKPAIQKSKPADKHAGGVVMVVDDEFAVRAIATGVLKHFGYRTIEAVDGVEALELFDKHPEIDLILMDMTMPRLCGSGTFKELCRKGCKAPVVICSGFLLDLVEFESEHGVKPAGFIQKPYSIDSMIDVVKEMLNPACPA